MDRAQSETSRIDCIVDKVHASINIHEKVRWGRCGRVGIAYWFDLGCVRINKSSLDTEIKFKLTIRYLIRFSLTKYHICIITRVGDQV